ncbi:RNA-binding RNA annealing protein, partial [Elasticomyces elasticus]
EYFAKSAGPVKRVILTYNQNGSSRGVANIIFSKPETAAKAAKDLNGLLVDGKPMKIEVIVDASYAPGVPAPKPLTERIAYVFLSAAALLDESHKTKDPNELIKRKTASQSKSQSQPKPATGGKAATAAGNGRRGRRTARRGGGRASNRPKPKTTEELDAEMDDYFDTTENGAAPTTAAVNGQAQPGQQQQQQPAAANGGDDVGMAEIS